MNVNGADVVLFAGGSGEPLRVSPRRRHRLGIQLFRIVGAEVQGLPALPSRLWRVARQRRHHVDRRLRAPLSRAAGSPELDKVQLVGLSLGGWIAATLATQNSHRLKKLVLVGPAGLRVPEHPTTGHFPPQAGRAAGISRQGLERPRALRPDPGSPEFLDFLVNDYHEMSSFARLAWERPVRPEPRQVAAPDRASRRCCSTEKRTGSRRRRSRRRGRG